MGKPKGATTKPTSLKARQLARWFHSSFDDEPQGAAEAVADSGTIGPPRGGRLLSISVDRSPGLVATQPPASAFTGALPDSVTSRESPACLSQRADAAVSGRERAGWGSSTA